MANQITPVHKHDCDACTFLGSIVQKETTFDLYFCPQDTFPTVIARFGKNGDYLSGMVFANKPGPLQIAKQLAILNGLMSS